MRRFGALAGAALAVASLATVLQVAGERVRPGSPPGPESRLARSGSAKPQPAVEPMARALLDRAAAAPSRTAYRGVQVVSAWTSTLASSAVVTVENDPARGTVMHSPATAQTPGRDVQVRAVGPSLSVGGAVALLAARYSLAQEGTDQVAGRPVEVVVARWPGVGATGVAGRFWLDRQTGLVLRQEVYDRRGRTLRASAFIDVRIGGSAGPATEPARSANAWTATVGADGLARLRREGWRCPYQLPGPLALVDARLSSEGILHLSYSDGLATVSVFEQRGRLAGQAPAGYQRQVSHSQTRWVRDGVPRRVMWSSGGTVYTVVADAPRRTVDAVVEALPHGPADDGVHVRLGRGLNRLASWFNPFG